MSRVSTSMFIVSLLASLGVATPAFANDAVEGPSSVIESPQQRWFDENLEGDAVIPDPVFADFLRRSLGLGQNQPIPLSELQYMTFMNMEGLDVHDLTGIEGAPYLISLNVSDTQVTDLSPLRDLKHLEYLTATDNGITDLSPLRAVTGLRSLTLDGNEISDISALSELPELRDLLMYGNRVSDLSPLAPLKHLYQLSFGDNQVTDISPLAGKDMSVLGLWNNQIRDFSTIDSMELEHFLLAGQNLETPRVFVPRGASEVRTAAVPQDLISRAPRGDEKNVRLVGIDWETGTADLDGTRSFAITGDMEAVHGGYTTEVDGVVDALQPPVAGVMPEEIDPVLEQKGVFTAPIVWAEITSPVPAAQVELGHSIRHAMTVTAGFPVEKWVLEGEYPGVELGQDGVLTGAPSEAGRYAVTLIAQDKFGNELRQDVTFEVLKAVTGGGSGNGGSGHGGSDHGGSGTGTGTVTPDRRGTPDGHLAVTGAQDWGIAPVLSAAMMVVLGAGLLVRRTLRRSSTR